MDFGQGVGGSRRQPVCGSDPVLGSPCAESAGSDPPAAPDASARIRNARNPSSAYRLAPWLAQCLNR
jgi:hypothetical protein